MIATAVSVEVKRSSAIMNSSDSSGPPRRRTTIASGGNRFVEEVTARPSQEYYITMGYVKSKIVRSTLCDLTGFNGMGILPSMGKTAKAKRKGRPPVGDATMHQIAIRLPKPMLAAIDELTAGRLDQPERSAIIRQLLAEALQVRRR